MARKVCLELHQVRATLSQLTRSLPQQRAWALSPRTHWLTENAPPGRQDRWEQSALAFSLHTCELLGESPQHPEPQLPTGLGGGHNTCAVRRLLGGLSSPVHQGCLT